LNLDQACGATLDVALGERRQVASKTGQLVDLVALGALLADLGEFSEADQIYRRALREYRDVSPFPVAWVCFQLGMLWGEQVSDPEPARAEHWYRKAMGCLPCYVKARVHLAEICSGDGRTSDAEAILTPAIVSGDPEVHWRLADVLTAQGRHAEAQAALEAGRCGFEALLAKHPLAFADHGAEFYAGSGADPARAFALAMQNLANRPTLRAFEQAHTTARAAGETLAASELLARARTRWGSTAAFHCSSLAMEEAGMTEGQDRLIPSLIGSMRSRGQADART
jgi:tetratricopeptide (TPR) repeat protein